MAAHDANLLFGLLALQADLVSRDALIAAMNAWGLAKHRSLGEILVEQGALSAESCALIEALVRQQIFRHGGDLQESLDAAARSADRSLRESLRNLTGFEGLESLSGIEDEYGTPPPPAEGPSSQRGARFRVLRPHARGGLGEVHVAEDLELHREVALKRIQDRFLGNRQARERFLLEAEVTGGLEHPGIVPVYGLGTDSSGRPFYAMRFIKGDSLREAIDRFHRGSAAARSGAMSGARNLQLRHLLGRFIDVCQAVHYAHSRGVLHRDLKPGNIMLGQYGETLVVDWGLAKPVGRRLAAAVTPREELTLNPQSGSSLDETVPGGVIGTPAYMSPEQAAGQVERIGPRTDVYGLGATLYTLLTGCSPFQEPRGSGTVDEVLARVRRGDFPRPRALARFVPKPLEAICLKAMATEADGRYATPGDLADDLERWLADEPVTAYAEPWTTRARRWISRHRTWIAGVAAAVVVAAVLLSFGLAVVTSAYRRERHERQRADSNAQLARRAVDEFLNRVADDPELLRADFSTLRTRLLESAIPYYEALAAQQGNGADAAIGRADARNRLATIYTETSRWQLALEQTERALEIARDAEARYPDVGEIPLVIAHSLRRRGEIAFQEGRFDQARSDLEEAARRLKQSAQRWPELPVDDEASAVHSSLGMLADETGRRADALTHFEESIAAAERALLREPSPDRTYLFTLALGNFAGRLAETGQIERAQEQFSRAVALRRDLVAKHPQRSDFRRGLALSLGNLGLFYANQNDFAKALALGDEAIETADALSEQMGRRPEYEAELARQLGTAAGHALRIGGGDERAAQRFLRALRILRSLVEEAPRVVDYRLRLANTLANYGTLLARQGKREEWRQIQQEALAHYEHLVERAPPSLGARLALITSLNNFGLELRRDDVPSAREPFERAWTIVEPLLTGDAPRPEASQLGFETLANLADLLLDEGDLTAAADRLAQAEALLGRWRQTAGEQDLRLFEADLAYERGRMEQIRAEQLAPGDAQSAARESALRAWEAADGLYAAILADAPEHFRARVTRCQGAEYRADLLERLGRHGEAAHAWELAAELSDASGRTPREIAAACAYARSGDAASALRRLESVRSAELEPAQQFEAARVCALLLGIPNAGDDQAGLWTEWAVAALERARARQFFDDAARCGELDRHDDFRALRARPEFAEFRKTLMPPGDG